MTNKLSLIIDTTHANFEVLLCDNKKIIVDNTFQVNGKHAELLINTISNILKEHGYGVSDIRNVFAIKGPGSFTGIRIGLTFAKVLATSLNIKAFGISSMEKLLTTVQKDKLKAYNIVIFESSINHKYFQIFDNNSTPLSEAFIWSDNLYQEKIAALNTDASNILNIANTDSLNLTNDTIVIEPKLSSLAPLLADKFSDDKLYTTEPEYIVSDIFKKVDKSIVKPNNATTEKPA